MFARIGVAVNRPELALVLLLRELEALYLRRIPMWFPSRALLCAALLILSGCAASDQLSTAGAPTTTVLADSVSTNPEISNGAVTLYSDDWRIGVDYEGVRFLADGVELDPTTVTVSFTGRRGMSVTAGGCSVGGGTFIWTDGLVSDWEQGFLAEMCQPTDEALHFAAQTMVGGGFTLFAEGNRLLLRTAGYELELETDQPGVVVMINDNERFVGVSSDVPGLVPAAIQLESPAFFVAVATTPTCQVHGGFSVQPDGRSVLNLPPRDGQCEFSPASDQTARAFLESVPTAARDGDSLTLTGTAGSLTLRLAGDQSAPIEWENVPPPPLVNPGPPTRPGNTEAGRPSNPWFTPRAGTTASEGIDVPVPPEWEATDPEQPSANIVGRGGISASRSAMWTPKDTESGDLKQIDGPVPVSTPTYQLIDGLVVETGRTLDGVQYRFASSTSFSRALVWVFEGDGDVIVLTASFPEFPEGSVFGTDTRNQSLTGLDPAELLRDIRIFE